MLDWLTRLLRKIAAWLRPQQAQSVYRRSNLHGRHR